MKKILLICIALLICVGCSVADSPSVVTEQFLATRKQNARSYIGDYLGEVDDSTVEVFGSLENIEKFYELCCDYEYEIKSETIEEDTAKVKIEFLTYDFKGLLSKFLTNYFSDLFSIAFSGTDLSDEEITSMAAESFQKEVEATKQKGKISVNPVTIYLNKIDGKWVVDDQINIDEIQNAMTGNLLNALDESLASLEDLIQ